MSNSIICPPGPDCCSGNEICAEQTGVVAICKTCTTACKEIYLPPEDCSSDCLTPPCTRRGVINSCDNYSHGHCAPDVGGCTGTCQGHLVMWWCTGSQTAGVSQAGTQQCGADPCNPSCTGAGQSVVDVGTDPCPDAQVDAGMP